MMLAGMCGLEVLGHSVPGVPWWNGQSCSEHGPGGALELSVQRASGQDI